MMSRIIELSDFECRMISIFAFDDLDDVDSLKDYVAYMLKHEPRRQNGRKNQV